MRRVVLGVYSYLVFGLLVVAWLPLIGAVALVARRDVRRRGRWMRRFGRVTSRLSPLWHFSVEDPAPRDIGHAAYVVVANHESSADPFLLSLLPWDMRWIAKESLFKLPAVGWLMHASADIPLRRGDGASVRVMMREAAGTLASGLSVMVFPEGTRSADGSLGRFKDGAFQLAIEAGVPILPLAIEGTRACRPKGSRWFGDADARVRVLAPIPTQGLTADDLPALRERAREAIATALADMRGIASRACPASPPSASTTASSML